MNQSKRKKRTNNIFAKQPPAWSRLDNAAKIFPSNTHGVDSGVFRLTCELRHTVDALLLQDALDESTLAFPQMCAVMRKGVFWYYLEQSDLTYQMVPETTAPCTPLYEGSHSPLFQVSYWKNKINLDMYHVLADGSGAIAFFQDLVVRYLTLYKGEKTDAISAHAHRGGRQEDGFQKYYKAREEKGAAKGQWAYRIRSEVRKSDHLLVIEGVCDVTQVLAAAHKYNTTLTVYLTAVLFLAIHDGMYVRDMKKPVVLTVPVDLRSYFPLQTTRNFFGTIAVSYDFANKSAALEDVIACVAQQFRENLTPQRLAARMNKLASLEHNLVLRPIPRILKNPVLRIAGTIATRYETAVLSNVGKFRMPERVQGEIAGFGVFMATDTVQLCTCSYEKSFHMGFTSALQSTEVQRCFFKRLTDEGIDIAIRSNEFHREE